MEIMTELEKTLKRNMLRFHCGREIFCPGCRQVLDARRAVEIDFHQGGNLAHSAIRCASCFDARAEYWRTPTAEGLTREIVDGRALWEAPASPAARKPSVKKPEPVPGRTYLVKHTSGTVPFKYVAKKDASWRGSTRAVWHFVGINLKTGREIELKSRARFIREVVAGDSERLPTIVGRYLTV